MLPPARAYDPWGPPSVASQLLQFLQRLRKGSFTGVPLRVPSEFEDSCQDCQRLAMLARTRKQTQVFPWSPRPVRLPHPLPLQERNSRPVREMNRVAPLSLRRRRPRLLQPDRPLLRRDGKLCGHNALEAVGRPDAAVREVPQSRDRQPHEYVDEILANRGNG